VLLDLISHLFFKTLLQIISIFVFLPWITFLRHTFPDKYLFDSGSEGSSGDSNDHDKILVSIKELEVTPGKIRGFLPKVNWEQLASMYFVDRSGRSNRSGAECQARYVLS
jgi:hypothetical protein